MSYDYERSTLSPTLGRWIHQDPLGYVDGMNRYEFEGSNVVHRLDPFGTSLIMPSTGTDDVFPKPEQPDELIIQPPIEPEDDPLAPEPPPKSPPLEEEDTLIPPPDDVMPDWPPIDENPLWLIPVPPFDEPTRLDLWFVMPSYNTGFPVGSPPSGSP